MIGTMVCIWLHAAAVTGHWVAFPSLQPINNLNKSKHMLVISRKQHETDTICISSQGSSTVESISCCRFYWPVFHHFPFEVAAHGPSGAWGTIAVSLFAQKHCAAGNSEVVGIFFGGGADGWKHLGIQTLGVLILCGISLSFTYVIVMLVDFLFGFRCSRACELIGLDFWEHQFDDGCWVISEMFSRYFQPNMVEEISTQSIIHVCSCMVIPDPTERSFELPEFRKLNQQLTSQTVTATNPYRPFNPYQPTLHSTHTLLHVIFSGDSFVIVLILLAQEAFRPTTTRPPSSAWLRCARISAAGIDTWTPWCRRNGAAHPRAIWM